MTLSDKTTLGYEGRKWKRVEDVKEFIKELKDFIGERERETMEEIIGRGLTARERDWLHNEVKGKLTNIIDKLAGDKLI